LTLEGSNFGSTLTASVTVEVIVCGDETIEVAEEGQKIFRLAKDSGTVELFLEAALELLFSLNGSAKCQISSIEVVNSDGTDIAVDDELGTLLFLDTRTADTDALSFDTSFTSIGSELE